MLDFVTKYWVEFCFGLIGSAVIWWIKRFYSLTQERHLQDQKDFKNALIEVFDKRIEEMSKESEVADQGLRADMEVLSLEIENLTSGVLSLQRKNFIAMCHFLLEPGHVITIEEYEELEEEHVIYKQLGGNHKGDSLHKSVIAKWNAQLGK